MFSKKEVRELCRFLRCAGGNWRNAIYIECSACPYSQASCSGYLLAADADGKPVLCPIERLHGLAGEHVSKEECIGVLSRQAFDALFSQWLLWHTESDQCGIRQMFQSPGRPDQ